MLNESIEKCFKLFDFNIYNERDEQDSGEEDGKKRDTQRFVIQMFGIDENGKTYSAKVEEYQPFFYVKVGDEWSNDKKNQFLRHLKEKVGTYFENSIVDCKIIKKKKLYGFDGGKEYKFLLIKFANVPAFNKVKAFWYKDGKNEDGENERKLIPGGYNFKDELLPLYEGHVPPLLRFFHIGEISPSGWVSVPNSKMIEVTGYNKTTTCDYEFIVNYKSIIPLNNKETIVPYKIMSYDIEASSSHGDFPVPIKSYKKLAVNIADYFYKNPCETREECVQILFRIIKTAFKYDNLENVDIVYTKYPVKDLEDLEARFNNWIQTKVRDYSSKNDELCIESFFELLHADMEKQHVEESTEETNDINMLEDNTFNPLKVDKIVSTYENKQSTIVDILLDNSLKRDSKVDELVISLKSNFPPVEGDKVTFIGSTFVKYGQPEPYLNHCIVLNTCDSLDKVVPNSQIESYQTEQEVLLAWTQLVQRENPDIVIGYNIFSFDYEFMFRRAQECGCVEEFLLLSRNQGELCATTDYKTGKMNIDKSSITLASGTYDLSIIKMNGRLQIDMYNWFRRTENLVSYKLDYVGGCFIGDYVLNLAHDESRCCTRVYTKNMTGLQTENYIHFEEINYSSDYYKGGAKFRVICVNKDEKWFEIEGIEKPYAKSVKWGLAKDDVTPKDIFRMTNEGPASRAVIAKYCIQDCNLVHHLFNKVDVITDLVEMARLCSVPMSFLVFRGQGIKLTSYVAKKCREKNTLIPTINKGDRNDAYEGAIVLEPKCGLYLDNPISVGDFASLYPSSMLSENLCPSSKVWKKVYDLQGNLVKEIGETNEQGKFVYDNIPGYEYVNITFDTYRYKIKSQTANGPTYEKVKSGHAVCRYAQPQIKDGKEEKAIMPSILQELLKARKDTRKMIPQQSDEFMKNVLDKRQLAYKVTANSLYGQLGAKTSTFYEPDVAAATTATGRLLLTYAKRVVEECYGSTEVETKNHGFVTTKAEYIYGDTDSVFFTFNLADKNGTPIRGDKALELSIEIAQEACHMVSSFLKQPHDFEYEKTFMPLCLLSKKRYVGMLYEFDPKKGKRKEMGIVLKRRDNAPIVKDVYGGIIDIFMKEANIQSGMNFLDKSLQDLVNKRVPMEKLIITKSLNSYYKNPQQIAHKVLADRIAARDPGNKPSSGDRIPFVYIVNTKKTALQGDKIEIPSYIVENNVKIDYSFYITNQIMKPLLQLFGLVLEDIWKLQGKQGKITMYKQEIEKYRRKLEPEKFKDKVKKITDAAVEELLFSKHLRETNNQKTGNQAITSFFTKK